MMEARPLGAGELIQVHCSINQSGRRADKHKGAGKMIQVYCSNNQEEQQRKTNTQAVGYWQ